MSESCIYFLDKKKVEFKTDNKYEYGKKILLSNKLTDPSFSQNWYKKGYKINQNFFSKNEFNLLKKKIEKTIIKILYKHEIKTDNFKLEKYHKFVKTNKSHAKVVKITSKLFQKNLFFNIEKLIQKMEKLLKFKLTNKNEINGEMHVILRIIRPKQHDFNLVHKDIYEHYDRFKKLPKFINFWIPICGVNQNSSLAIAPGTHLVPENKILRSIEGAIINKNKYRTNNIKSWNGKNNLKRVKIAERSILVFSSHLIHGCGINMNSNKTRIALEFRLFRKNF